MRDHVNYFALVLLSFFLVCGLSFADPTSTQDSEATHYEEARKLVASTRLFPDPSSPHHQWKICKGLLKAFRSGRQLKIVEPILRTNDALDPALDPYKKMCPGVPLLGYYGRSQNFYREIKALEPTERRSLISQDGVIWEARPPLSLYQVELNGDHKDGFEYLLFFQSSFGPIFETGQPSPPKVAMRPHVRYGGYKILALRDWIQLE